MLLTVGSMLCIMQCTILCLGLGLHLWFQMAAVIRVNLPKAYLINIHLTYMKVKGLHLLLPFNVAFQMLPMHTLC